MSSTWDSAPATAGHRLSTGLFLIAVAIVPFAVDDLIQIGTGTQLLLADGALVLLCLASLRLALGIRGNAQGLARWRVGPWFLLWSVLAYGLATLTWLGPQTGVALRIAPESVVHALAIVFVAIGMWSTGYLLNPPLWILSTCRRIGRVMVGRTVAEFRGTRAIWVLYGIGTLARLAGYALSGQFGFIGDPRIQLSEASWYANALAIASTTATFGVALAAYTAFASPTVGGRIRLSVLVLAEFGIGALSGMKESFVITGVAVLIPYGAVRGRLPWRMLVAGALAFLIATIPFNATYRQYVRSTSGNASLTQAIAQVPDLVSNLASLQAGDLLASSTAQLLKRVREIDNTAIITQLTPSVIGYRSPRTFPVDAIAGFIPRAIWPNKPLNNDGYLFSHEYYGYASNVYTSSAITPIGDLYRHGGWMVLVIGMLLLGIGYRLLDTFCRAEADIRAIFVLLVLLPDLVKFEADISSLLRSLPSAFIAAALGVRLACRRRARVVAPS